MKRLITLSGLILIVALAASSCRNSDRRFDGRFDHNRMHRHESAMDFRNMRNMNNIRSGRGFYMRPGRMMGRGQGNMAPRFNREGIMRFNRIPGITEKQRQEIADLRLKHMQEMDKFREETFAKMQDLREANRKEMMNILTPEQQKFLESGASPDESGSTPAQK